MMSFDLVMAAVMICHMQSVSHCTVRSVDDTEVC